MRGLQESWRGLTLRVGAAYRTFRVPPAGPSVSTSGPESPAEPAVPEVLGPVVDVVQLRTTRSERETDRLLDAATDGSEQAPELVRPGPALNRRSPLYIGFMAVLGGLIAYGLVHVVLLLTQILLAIVVALVLALGLEPLVARLCRWGLRRVWAVVVVFVALILVFAALGWLIVPTVATQSTDVIRQTPTYLDHLQHTDLARQLNARWHVTDKISQELSNHVLTQTTLTSLYGGIIGATKAVLHGILAVLTVLVLTLYFLAAMPGVKRAAYMVVPRSRRPRVIYLSEEIAHRVGGYVLGQVCIAFVNGLLSYVILRILGLPFPLLLSIVVGLLALVPVLGTPVGGVIVTLVALTHGWVSALIVFGYYVLYHFLEAYLVGPRIMRRTVEIPPMLTIIAILAGETLLGIVGALIAIPIAAALLLVYEQVLVPRQQAN
jgi:predicted PurR-regulated permease PerM